MSKEDIKKAKVENAERIANIAYSGGGHIGQDDLETAFENGADWRINSVWHNDTEKPDPDKGGLLVGIEVMGKTAYIRQNAYYVLQFGCVRWAYVEDLKPNTED